MEDNRADEQLMRRALKKAQIDAELAVARDGQQALDYLFGQGEYAGQAATLPALVLLDINLPRLSGLEVLRVLRDDVRTHNIPVVMVSSSDMECDRQASYAIGADGYVTKQRDFAAFVAELVQLGARWLDQPPAACTPAAGTWTDRK